MCPDALQDIQNKKIPHLCEFKDADPIVCCISVPSGIFLPAVVTSEEDTGCGTVTPEKWPVGGGQATRGEVPWHAVIYLKTVLPYKQVCGGSLISTSFIISAAQCFWSNIEGRQSASNYAAAVGKLYRPWNYKVQEEAQQSDVKAIHIPVRFQGEAAHYQDDIAVVVVSRAFEYKTHIRPVCLDFDINLERRQLQFGNPGKIAGWGLPGENGNASQVLRVMELTYVIVATCISESPAAFREYITYDKVCADVRDGNALCKGESGGGLAFPESERGKTRYYLRGVVSSAPEHERLCIYNHYTTFTQVLKHEHFIKEFWKTSL